MQIGIAIFSVIALAILHATGGLYPESEASDAPQKAESVEVTNVASVGVSETARTETTSRPTSSRQPAERVSVEIVEDYRTPLVDTESVRNVENNRALIRASVDMRSYKGGTVFVVYGYNRNQVNSLSRSTEVLDRGFSTNDDRARVTIIDLNPRGEEDYEKRISSLVSGADYYYRVCLEYTDLTNRPDRVCSAVETFSTNPTVSLNPRFRSPSISAGRALYVTASEASIEVNLQMNDGEDGVPFIVYGLFKEFVDEIDEDYSSYSAVREYEADLQKIRLGVGRLGRSQYQVELDDLLGGRKYYYRSCVEYDGRREGLVCSGTRSFDTDAQSKRIKPFAATNMAQIDGVKIDLSGRVQMGDFFDGYAFFVYGTDLARVKNVAGNNSFSRIKQSVDRLQKIAVDADVDRNDSFRVSISDLQPGELYHYRLCVQYVDENKYGREEFFINCGAVRSFASLD